MPLFQLMRVPKAEVRNINGNGTAPIPWAPRRRDPAEWGETVVGDNELPFKLNGAETTGATFECVSDAVFAVAGAIKDDRIDKVCFDIAPKGPRSCSIYVMVPPDRLPPEVEPRDRHQILVFDYNFTCLQPMTEMEYRHWFGTWTRTRVIDPLFQEPFWVVARRASDHFITASGQLFTSDLDGNGTATTTPKWTAERGRILAVLHSGGDDKYYAFTAGSFFEIADTLEPKPFDIGPLDQVKPDGPLPTLRRCVQALDAAGLLKPKPKE